MKLGLILAALGLLAAPAAAAQPMQVMVLGTWLAIFGTSHACWLRHFAREVNGFENVDPRPYLRRAAEAAR